MDEEEDTSMYDKETASDEDEYEGSAFCAKRCTMFYLRQAGNFKKLDTSCQPLDVSVTPSC